jgi:uncharacterized repeat protein (TIGR01451 family)
MRTEKEPEPAAKRLSAEILAGVFVMVAGAVSIPAYASGSSPAQRTTGSSVGQNAGGKVSASASQSRTLLPATESLPETITYAADCSTPQTTFNLGQTVCARATAVIGFRLQWVDPDGFAVNTTDITTDPQNDFFVLPSTDQSAIGGFFTANNLGRWRVNAITSRNSVKTSAFFTVKDPGNPKADLSIVKSIVGSPLPTAGDPIQFAVTIVNEGPDDAVNTRFVDNVFTNAIFDSLSQTSGPPFTCSGGDCQIKSFPNGAVATFLLNFKAGPAGGIIENTASVSSETPELNQRDNSATAAPIRVATTGPPPTCDIEVTAPASVTLYTGPGATSCGVVVNNLDTTLGTASATDNCELVGDVTRSGVPAGNNFPVGTTTITYSATDVLENTASAIQIVTVIDNTPPTITCPQNITLEPTCPAGAVATWTAPVGADNCPDATTAQSGGPANGSVIPSGTTISVAYTVSDAAGNQASCAFTVTVLTVQATIENLETSVGGSSLTGTQQQGLLPKLNAALDAFTRGNTKAACNTLSDFIKSVQNHVDHGDIPSAQGQEWINSATHVGNAIGCTNNPCS